MADPLLFLVSDVARLVRRRFDERARSIGVTRAQWRTLTFLSRDEGATQGSLADQLEVEPITMCRMIDRLEEAELVERRRSPHDRRAWNIYLTDRSRPLLDDLRRVGDEVTGEVLGGIAIEQRRAVAAALERMLANLTAPAPDASAAIERRETTHG